MNLDDVLSNPETERYFNNLPEDIRRKLMKDEQEIQTSNDLYIKAENLLRSSEK